MIHFFIGTKAQLIKIAPIMTELNKRKVEYNFIWTGQHKETIDDLRNNFGIRKPDIILYDGKDITGITSMFLWSLRIISLSIFRRSEIWKDDKKGIVIVHGDTFSTLLGAFLSKILGYKCAHVESGLRSFNFFNPFPEELTRVIVFHLCNIFYAPGSWAFKNITKYNGYKINTKTNTLFDAISYIKKIELNTEKVIPTVPYILVSIHRFENIFNRKKLEYLIEILSIIANSKKIVFILHAPTKKKLIEFNLFDCLNNHHNIELRPRYDYLTFIKILEKSEFLFTDGGSNQEECSYIGKPCILFRFSTERREGIRWNTVISKYDKNIILKFCDNYQTYDKVNRIRPHNLSPSTIIVKHLIKNRYN